MFLMCMELQIQVLAKFLKPQYLAKIASLATSYLIKSAIEVNVFPISIKIQILYAKIVVQMYRNV